MNTTMARFTNLTSTTLESRDWFIRPIPNFVTNDLVCGVMISIIFLVMACFHYVFRSIHASDVRATSNAPNNVQFGRIARVPIEMHVVPNNPPNNFGYRMAPGNSILTHPLHARTTYSSRDDQSNARIAYKLQMHPEKV